MSGTEAPPEPKGKIMDYCHYCDEILSGPVRSIGDYVFDEEWGEEIYADFLVHVTCP